MVRQFKIVVEKTSDGYVAYPLGLKGVVVGEGDSYEEALADVKSAIQFHIETFGGEVLESIGNPNEGLEIRQPLRDRLLRKRKAVAAGERGEPFEDVVRYWDSNSIKLPSQVMKVPS